MMNLSMHFTAHRDEFAIEVRHELTGDIWGVFGPSGSGKTTLLNVLAGLVAPTAGRAEIDGETLFDVAAGVNTPVHRRQIGYVFQENRLFGHLNVKGNLNYALRLTPKRNRQIQWDAVVDLLELGPLLRRPIGTLSGGQRRRVAIGRALLASPRLLLLDEPLTGLDQPRKTKILEFLGLISRTLNVGMLLVSHEPTEILALTEKVLRIDEGQLVEPDRRWMNPLADMRSA